MKRMMVLCAALAAVLGGCGLSAPAPEFSAPAAEEEAFLAGAV